MADLLGIRLMVHRCVVAKQAGTMSRNVAYHLSSLQESNMESCEAVVSHAKQNLSVFESCGYSNEVFQGNALPYFGRILAGWLCDSHRPVVEFHG